MKRLTLFFVFLVGVALCEPASAGNSWLFRPSYYSHHPSHPVTVGRRAATGRAAFSPTYGEFVRSGYRQTRSSIYIPRGGGYDQVNVIESWVQFGSQY